MKWIAQTELIHFPTQSEGINGLQLTDTKDHKGYPIANDELLISFQYVLHVAVGW